jgi:hypothetical protein
MKLLNIFPYILQYAALLKKLSTKARVVRFFGDLSGECHEFVASGAVLGESFTDLV